MLWIFLALSRKGRGGGKISSLKILLPLPSLLGYMAAAAPPAPSKP